MLGRICIALFLLPILTFGYVSPGVPKGFVSDFGGMFTLEQRSSLEEKLSEFQKATGGEIALVTVKSLEGDTVENFAVELFEEWGLGKSKSDNGVLFLISRDDRKVRIEVGYGLEPYLTDARSSVIIRKIISPTFQAGRFYEGTDAAVEAILAILKGADPEILSTKPGFQDYLPKSFDILAIGFFLLMWMGSVIGGILGRSKSWWGGGVLGLVLGGSLAYFFGFFYMGLAAIIVLVPVGLVFDFIVSREYARSVGRSAPWWVGGSGWGGYHGGGFRGGGGFGGFGGGRSGGGGASGGW